VIVAFSDERGLRTAAERGGGGAWKRLLCLETAMLLAPECERCGCFHLRAGFYEWKDGRVRNLRLASARALSLGRLGAKAEIVPAGGACGASPRDFRFRVATGAPS
jgi:hypothetical protein